MLSILAHIDVSSAQTNILFGKIGKRYTIPKGKFPKWDDMQKRREREKGLKEQQCESGFFNACYLQDLQELISEIHSASAMSKLEEINKFTNRMRYQEDRVIYGVNDYWATPQEFFDNATGDCEDYSISKYYALKSLGFIAEQLQIAVVKDININVYHAILIVKQNNKNYLLDNRLYDIAQDTQIKHYKIIYTINENFWWFYPP